MKQLKYVFIALLSCVYRAPFGDGIMSCMPDNRAEYDKQVSAQEDMPVERAIILKLTLMSGNTSHLLKYPSATDCLNALKDNPRRVLRQAYPDLRLAECVRPAFIFKNTGTNLTEDTKSDLFMPGINEMEVILNIGERFRHPDLRLIVKKPFGVDRGEMDFYNPQEGFDAFCERNALIDTQTKQASFCALIQFRIIDTNLGTESCVLLGGNFNTARKLVEWLGENPDFVESALQNTVSATSLALSLQYMLIKSHSTTNNFVFNAVYQGILQQTKAEFEVAIGDTQRIFESRNLMAKIHPGNSDMGFAGALAYYCSMPFYQT